MSAPVNTFQQTIELAFRLNDSSVAEVEQKLNRAKDDRQDIFRTAYGNFSEMAESYRRERDQSLEQYMSEFSQHLKERTDLTSEQAQSLESIERERIAKIMELIESSNNDLLAVTGGMYREEELARSEAVNDMIAADNEVRQIRRTRTGEKKDDEEGGSFWAAVYDGLNKAVGILHSMGAPIAALTIEELGRFGVASYEHRVKERKAEYQMAAAGGQLTPSGATFDMKAYTEGIHDLRVKFPSLREQFDTVALTLRRQVPDMGAQDIIALTDDVRRLSFYTGESMETLANEIGTLARRIRVPSSELAGKMLWMTELGRFYVRSNNTNIEIGKFRQNIINLAEQNKQYGMSVEEAGAMVFRFAKELDKGILSLEDIASLTLGYSRTDPTARAFAGQEALEWMKDRPGFERLYSILSKVAHSEVALQEAVRGIASKSKVTFDRLGISDLYEKEGSDLAQKMTQSYIGGLSNFANEIGGNIHEQRYHLRELAQQHGMLRGDTPIGVAQDLIEAGLEGIDMKSPEGVAAKAIGNMNDWRGLVDDNQKITESKLEQLWELVRMGGASLMRFTDGMSNTVSHLLQQMNQPPADIYNNILGGAVDQAKDVGVVDIAKSADATLNTNITPTVEKATSWLGDKWNDLSTDIFGVSGSASAYVSPKEWSLMDQMVYDDDSLEKSDAVGGKAKGSLSIHWNVLRDNEQKKDTIPQEKNKSAGVDNSGNVAP